MMPRVDGASIHLCQALCPGLLAAGSFFRGVLIFIVDGARGATIKFDDN